MPKETIMVLLTFVLFCLNQTNKLQLLEEKKFYYIPHPSLYTS